LPRLSVLHTTATEIRAFRPDSASAACVFELISVLGERQARQRG
jgi:hypothetical protein